MLSAFYNPAEFGIVTRMVDTPIGEGKTQANTLVHTPVDFLSPLSLRVMENLNPYFFKGHLITTLCLIYVGERFSPYQKIIGRLKYVFLPVQHVIA